MASSNSSACGAFTPTRRWSELHYRLTRSPTRSRPGSSRTPTSFLVCPENSNGRDRPGHDQTQNDAGRSALLAQPRDQVDAGDLVAFRHIGHLREHKVRVGNIDQLVIVLEIEVMVRRHIGVEISLRAVDADLTQKAGVGKLIERV